MAGRGPAALRTGDALLQVRDLVVEYPAAGGTVSHAVSEVGFDIRSGETLGVVGESGCGKSTMVRALLQLPGPTSGSIRFDGRELTELRVRQMRRMRRRIQFIQQDPIASLNPRRRVRDIVAEGLAVWSIDDRERRVREVIEAVGMDVDVVGDRRPGEFSGGQCQRVAIARALAVEPDMLVCDEPVSALDVSVQAQILNLLHDLRDRLGITLVFVSHDLSVIKLISDRVLVLYLGRTCEIGSVEEIFAAPAHPYTRLLLDSVPVPDPDATPQVSAGAGEMPSASDPPSGCRFRTRCPLATEICATKVPQLRSVGIDHVVACHHAGESDASINCSP